MLLLANHWQTFREFGFFSLENNKHSL
ncbi:hypothetical protein SAMN05444412_106215 [Rhodonellum ikkaensis]|uniref:Uncharacterized protein n=1 Tax=Rhodonellum ikkaensis TaxID=336829 RepID=A0A1H3QPT0_9BACT|nr:hypothetical protein SAMN05444412_106215 [Rhodonellum ikkaensis]